MNGADLVFVGAVVAITVALLESAALVAMQERLCELKTDRDDARTKLLRAEEALAASRCSERQALADIEAAEQRFRFATNLLDEQQTRGFEHVNLAYPADALPDITTNPLEDDPWVAEMRERWLFDNTSEQ